MTIMTNIEKVNTFQKEGLVIPVARQAPLMNPSIQDSSELMLDQVINQQALTFYLGRSINCLI